jgi:hypothetical protein
MWHVTSGDPREIFFVAVNTVHFSSACPQTSCAKEFFSER